MLILLYNVENSEHWIVLIEGIKIKYAFLLINPFQVNNPSKINQVMISSFKFSSLSQPTQVRWEIRQLFTDQFLEHCLQFCLYVNLFFTQLHIKLWIVHLNWIGCQLFSYWICVGSICDSSGPLLEVVNVEEVLLEVKVVFSGLYGKSFGKFYALVSKDQRSKLCQMENDINCSKYVNTIETLFAHEQWHRSG